MVKPDETEVKIKSAMRWLEARRRDVQDQSRGIQQAAMYSWLSDDPRADRHRWQEYQFQIAQFDTLIAQHQRRLQEYRREQRLERDHRRLAKKHQQLERVRRQLSDKRLSAYRRQQLLERERQQVADIEEADPEPLMMAVPRPDVLTSIKIVDTCPTYADHPLTSQLSRRAESLEAWNYRCLGTRNRRPSRRYEGFQMTYA